jgi:hypothetical protein
VAESRKNLVPALPMCFLSLAEALRKLQAKQFSSVASSQIIYYPAFMVKPCNYLQIPRDLSGADKFKLTHI